MDGYPFGTFLLLQNGALRCIDFGKIGLSCTYLMTRFVNMDTAP